MELLDLFTMFLYLLSYFFYHNFWYLFDGSLEELPMQSRLHHYLTILFHSCQGFILREAQSCQ